MAISSTAKRTPPRVGTEPTARKGPVFELVEAKLDEPVLRSSVVPRKRLCDRLRSSGAVPVVAVQSPPGYGKTTLLAEWAMRDERPFAWVSLDEHDNDPVMFLSYVAAALDRISTPDTTIHDALSSPARTVVGSAIPKLGSRIACMPGPFVLVLDDLHLIDNRECLDAVEAIVRHLPSGSQLAVAGRSPPLQRPALRDSDAVVDVGVADLQMGRREASSLLLGAGLDLPDADVADLVTRTEGWPAGLYLASLFLKSPQHDPRAPASFAGDDRYLTDYLRAELVSTLSPSELRFLTRTSVLDRMSGPLCDATLGATGSRAMLESLKRTNLFVVPMDRRGEWYRYHRLFRDLLRSELRRREPQLVPRLIARAADWCEANGDEEAAITYAQAGRDLDRVARLVAARAFAARSARRATTVERWFDWLDEHGSIERYPAVATLAAWSRAHQGRPLEAERWADAASSGASTSPLPDGSASIGAWTAMLEAVLCRRGVERMGEDASTAVDTLTSRSPWRVTARVLLAISHLLRGDDAAADAALAVAIERGGPGHSECAISFALAQRALLDIKAGRWESAAERSDRAIRLIHDPRFEEYPPSAIVFVAAAHLSFHRGDLPRARDYIAKVQRLRPVLTYALPYLAVQARLELARLLLTMADTSGVRDLLHEIGVVLRRRPDLGTLVAQADDLRTELKAARADIAVATALTTAELRLLPFLSTHLSFREIGEQLFVSPHTVKSQAISIYRRLGANSRGDAVERSRHLGLLEA